MSAVLCLPACLCVSTAASCGQAPHGNTSVTPNLHPRICGDEWRVLVMAQFCDAPQSVIRRNANSPNKPLSGDLQQNGRQKPRNGDPYL